MSEIFLILRIVQCSISCVFIGLNVKYPVLLSEFKGTEIFSTDFREITKCRVS
jgi:hypothetical protein